jgi:malonyl-CoA/methylmalonyl-CoA synthetase
MFSGHAYKLQVRYPFQTFKKKDTCKKMRMLSSRNTSLTSLRIGASTIRRALQHSWSFPTPISPPSQEEVESQGLPLLRNAVSHADRPFLIDSTTEEPSAISYRTVLDKAASVAAYIRQQESSSTSPFVAHSALPGSSYIACQWGSFASGKASVPLGVAHTVPELEHVLKDSNPCHILICEEAPNCLHVMQAAVNLNLLDRVVYIPQLLSMNDAESAPIESLLDASCLGDQWDATPALLLYTSGTTGKPKGVVIRQGNLYHQITDLVKAWEWQQSDIALHVLPLHHVHGVVNILSCAAYCGARLQFQGFNATRLWEQWADGSTQTRPTVLMAVPTIYAKLLEAAKELPTEVVEQAVEQTLRPMRLQISGSAALPVSVMERWESLTGHRLLERYGMTEFAMALSNPHAPMSSRQPGHVGLPLPSVTLRLVEEETGEILETDGDASMPKSNTPGALEVRGPTVFTEYLNRPDATAEAFTDDGFFRTGDVALYNDELESFRILGRKSVDILKVGGHKVSALEIERELLEHDNILEVAIVGVPDEVWGQRVGLIGRTDNPELSLQDIQDWCGRRLSKYQTPTRLLWVSDIPKNAMGKVNKKDLVELF